MLREDVPNTITALRYDYGSAMSLSWHQREIRRDWATRNPAKVRAANAAWVAANLTKVRRQTAARMKRYRQRLAAKKSLRNT